MTRRLLVAQSVDPDGLRRVRNLLGPEWEVSVRPPFARGDTERSREVRDVEILFSDHCPGAGCGLDRLRWLQLGSSGYSQLRPLRLHERSVAVTNASGVFAGAIAEWSLLMMLIFERDLVRLLRQQRDHIWRRDARSQSELRGRRVGVIGSGGVGEAVATLVSGVGGDVRMLARRGTPLLGRYHPDSPSTATWPILLTGDRDRFFENLDYLVVALALNPGTVGFVGAADLARLSPEAVLVNPARAQLVDRDALVAALRSGRLRGAALDSHYREPLATDDPDWDLPNTIVTPHIAGSTGGPRFVSLVWDLFERNLRRYLAGSPLLNVIADGDLE